MRTMIIAAVCAATGLLAAFTLTASAGSPVALPDLPGLGYTLSMQFNTQTQCGIYTVISGNGVSSDIPIGDMPPRCVTAQEEQTRIDSLLRDFPPPGPAPVVTTVYATTTETVTLPAVTITETSPGATVTTPSVTVTATVQADPPAAVTVTAPPVVLTVTVPVAPDPGWLVALGIRSVALDDVYGLA